MNDLSLQFSVMAHLRPVTEVEVVRQVDAWVLASGRVRGTARPVAG